VKVNGEALPSTSHHDETLVNGTPDNAVNVGKSKAHLYDRVMIIQLQSMHDGSTMIHQNYSSTFGIKFLLVKNKPYRWIKNSTGHIYLLTNEIKA